MTKFEFIHNNDKIYKISTAIHNLKNELLNKTPGILQILKKQAEKCKLTPEKLLKKTIDTIKQENGGVLPENLKKYEK